MLNFIKNWFRPDANTPPEDDYQERVKSEQANFANCENVHALPDIFHYWSNKHLAPSLTPFGFSSPNDFFEKQIQSRCESVTPRLVKAISIGSGNCDLEADIASHLRQAGIENFRISCLDINPDMIARGKDHANNLGVESHIEFICDDFNNWSGDKGTYDIVMANQSLHHVLELEKLFDAVHKSLADDGLFLISDMIGRNGHMRWPEALDAMEPFWSELPPEYRYNQLMRRHEETFINHDCSTSGFEGIRAQDILPLLCERFEFKFFFPFGNIIFPFVDRTFGHNFKVEMDWDRDFIDRVHECDERSLLNGSLKPNALFAVAVKGPVETVLRDARLTPKACIREV
jgi:SAM-dependent methyltransferase